MDSIIQYLRDETLSEDNIETYRINVQSSRYWYSPDQVLYK